MKSIKHQSIDLKLQKAKLLYAEVEVLMEHQFYSTAINRLYYSCFHATKALLLTKDIIPKTHSGVVSMLHKHFVKEEGFDKEKASFFSQLMKERSEDDCSDFISYDHEAVKELILPANNYVQSLIQKFYNEHQ